MIPFTKLLCRFLSRNLQVVISIYIPIYLLSIYLSLFIYIHIEIVTDMYTYIHTHIHICKERKKQRGETERKRMGGGGTEGNKKEGKLYPFQGDRRSVTYATITSNVDTTGRRVWRSPSLVRHPKVGVPS